ncbi:hypothetical protein [Clostridium beijerinckii]|uniref:hypothetical protein n=1 Tax=Clostridium beijerinckii TaxID=1520 RepID=UPI002330A445|nr:hypothetical protein [Clostridium beijerinckii]
MSEAIQITLIVCVTIIFLSIITLVFMKTVIEKEFKPTNKTERDNDRFGYCKSPTYPGPKIPRTDSANSLKNIKPPSTGSGIK